MRELRSGTVMQATLCARRIVLVVALTQRAVELLQMHLLPCMTAKVIAVQVACPGSPLQDVRHEVLQEKEWQPIFSGPLRKDAGRIVQLGPTVLQLPLLQCSMRPRMNAAKRPTLGLTLIIVHHVLLVPLTKAILHQQEVTIGLLIMKMVSAVKIAIPWAEPLPVSGPTMVR